MILTQFELISVIAITYFITFLYIMILIELSKKLRCSKCFNKVEYSCNYCLYCGKDLMKVKVNNYWYDAH